MYINVGIETKVQKNLSLVIVCIYQMILVYSFEMLPLYDMSSSETRVQGGFTTNNFASDNDNKYVLQQETISH